MKKIVPMPPMFRIGPDKSEPLNISDFTMKLIQDFHIVQFCWSL